MRGVRDDAARWFTRMHDAAPEHPERGRFEAWLAASPVHAAEYSAIAEVWQDFETTASTQALARALERRTASQRADRRKQLKRGLLGVVLAIGCGFLGQRAWLQEAGQPSMPLARSTGVGEMLEQALPDGSEVLLDADSALEITYSADRRAVSLQRGAAIFDVAREPERPFVIDSGPAQVTVLGTRFVVNRLDDRVRVSVEHGRVRLAAAGMTDAPPLELLAGEVGEVPRGEAPRKLQRTAADAFAFRRGTLVFDEAPLAEVAEALSRHRRRPVHALGAASAAPRVTAVVQLTDIETFLQALPHIAPVDVREAAAATRLVAR